MQHIINSKQTLHTILETNSPLCGHVESDIGVDPFDACLKVGRLGSSVMQISSSHFERDGQISLNFSS